jgi:Beta-galactosidase
MWEDDARRMKALGIEQVRIAEFAWSRIEPTPGEYNWGWLDRAVDVLGAAGLQVVMCTPTATPPKWLIDRHPDILPIGATGVLARSARAVIMISPRLRISRPPSASAQPSPSVTASIRPSLLADR